MASIDKEEGNADHRRPGSRLRTQPSRAAMGRSAAGPQSATGEEMVAAMDAVGVDAAIIVSTFNLYRYDPSYALAVQAAYPSGFAWLSRWTTDPGDGRGRGELGGDQGSRRRPADAARRACRSDPTDPRLNRAFAAAGRHGLPVNFLCWGRLDDGAEMVRRNPDTVIVIDHLGLLQPNQAAGRRPNRGPICRSCSRWPRSRMSGSRSAAPARCRANRSRTTTSGIRC